MYFMANEIHNPNAFDAFNEAFKIQFPFPGDLIFEYDDPVSFFVFCLYLNKFTIIYLEK